MITRSSLKDTQHSMERFIYGKEKHHNIYFFLFGDKNEKGKKKIAASVFWGQRMLFLLYAILLFHLSHTHITDTLFYKKWKISSFSVIMKNIGSGRTKMINVSFIISYKTLFMMKNGLTIPENRTIIKIDYIWSIWYGKIHRIDFFLCVFACRTARKK